jgi:putative ABC transport system permease protein
MTISTWKYIKSSLWFYRRTHLGLLLGVALSTAIIVGALVIGDSVRLSLLRLVVDRLGKTEYALDSGDRFFRAALADELQKSLRTETAALLKIRGIAINPNAALRANQVQILGVDARFGKLGAAPNVYGDLNAGEIMINERLANKLRVAAGDEVLLRFEKPDALPRDAPLASDTDFSLSKRFRVKAVAATAQFGRFSLQNNQVTPFSAFLSRATLADILELKERANVLLIAERPGTALSEPELAAAQKAVFQPADVALTLKPLDQSLTELRSDRIFLDPPIVAAAQQLALPQQPIFTYFVNELRCGDHTTPYSFVSAPGAPIVPPALKDDEIILNDWTARDLDAKIGDSLSISYFVLGTMRTLVEQSRSFRIAAIVPLNGIYADGDLMPDFPGLSGQENCRDWDAGFPINYNKIRDKDEKYWDDFRGTPKAFVTLKAAQEMWGNRFGNLTAFRFAGISADSLQKALCCVIDPASLGFVFQPVRQQGQSAGAQSISFSQLFIGLSFFLIIAALLLTGLLFVFSAQQRSQESGLLLALGFRAAQVRRLLLIEGACVAICGGVIGVMAGLAYHQLILLALKTVWADIVGTSALQLYIKPLTLLTGFTAGVGMSLLSLIIVARQYARRSVADLYKGVTRLVSVASGKPLVSLIICISSLIAVLIILVVGRPGRGSEVASLFFLAGALMLIALLAFADWLILRLDRNRRALTLNAAGRKNIVLRRRQSLTVIGMLAAGVFIAFTVGINRIGSLKNADARSSGTGGFAFWGESSLPIFVDLNSAKIREQYGLTAKADLVELRVKDGDDASCLNLNRISNPRLLAVDTRQLDECGAFSFAQTTDDVPQDHPWRALEHQYADPNVIPAFADQTVIVWGLGKQVGDTLTYIDEQGKSFYVRLVGGLNNSIFQGNVIISESRFIERYPSVSGYRVFLIDASPDQREAAAQNLTWSLQDQGLELTPAAERLAEFNKITNTYLSIFMILGGLGLLIGSFGIGVVLIRQVMERRGELALMRAVGFNRSALRRMVFAEHILLLIASIGCGVAASLIAALPTLLTPGTPIPIVDMLVTLLLLFIVGRMWLLVASRWATSGDLLPALRNE